MRPRWAVKVRFGLRDTLMFIYFAMLALPGLLALTGDRPRSGLMLFLVAGIFWIIIGFRFQVGTDWYNYLSQFYWSRSESFTDALLSREPGFRLLNWFASTSGSGYIFINAITAAVFCWGFFSFARVCREPFLAVTIATPLVVIAASMNLTRQAIAFGIVSYLYSTWDKGTVYRRIGWVLAASLFHFSAVFVLTLVVLSAKIAGPVKVVAAIVVGVGIFGIVAVAPTAMDSYSRLYVSGEVTAPGAIYHVLVLASSAIVYLFLRRRWALTYGESALCTNMAIIAVLSIPAVYVSSVGAYRLSLYLWPMSMYVWSGASDMMETSLSRVLYRLTIIAASAVVLLLWLTFGNNSPDWLPYRSWLLQPAGVSLWH